MRCGCDATFNCGCNRPPPCSSLSNTSSLDFDWKHALAVGTSLALVGLAIGWFVSLEPLGLDPGWDVRAK